MKKWLIVSGVILSLFTIILSGFECTKGEVVTPAETETPAEELITVTTYSSEIQDVVDKLKNDYGILVTGKWTDLQDLENAIESLEKAASLLPPSVLTVITHKIRRGQEIIPLTVNFSEVNTYAEAKSIYKEEDIYAVTWPSYEVYSNKIELSRRYQPIPAETPFKPTTDTDDHNVLILSRFLHEMAHAWDYNSEFSGLGFRPFYDAYVKIIEEEKESPSLYAYTGYNKERGKIVIEEDFAESFTFYVILSEYLKQNFPLR